MKSRDETWTPKPILPASTKSGADDPNPHHLPLEFLLDPVSLDPGPEAEEWWVNVDPEDENTAWLPTDGDMFGFQSSDATHFDVESDSIRPVTIDFPATLFIGQSLSQYHMSLPNSLSLSTDEHDALRHYQTTFSLYRTTKDPNWSTHKVLLSLGSHNAMIMHLLLAVSINDQCLRKRQERSLQVAQNHFRAGALMLIDLMGNYTEADHVPLMAAYFFLYLYMSKRKSVAPQRLKQLSLTVFEFVRSHELDLRCLSSSRPSSQSQISPLDGNRYRSVLARLMMWTFDEDVKCSFQGQGGHFARYLTANGDRTKEVYDASRNALGTHWGAEYPNSQMLDDDQNSTVLEFLWALMSVWQDINDLTQHPDSIVSDINERIEQSFVLLEMVSASPSFLLIF